VSGSRRGSPNKSMVGFTLAGGKYAVAIEEVREIMHPTQLTTLPKAPLTVAGVVDHRGEVIVVVDLRTHFDLREPPRPSREKWILLRRSGVALVVDNVTDVFGSSSIDFRPAPPVRGEAQRGILGVITREPSALPAEQSLAFVVDPRTFEELSESLRVSVQPTGRAG
jgi:purine-binding chemotaxis protein CheW